MVTHRPATKEELPYLQKRIDESHHEKVRLYIEVVQEDGSKKIEPLCMCWVSEEDGQIIGLLPLRLIWQAEPLFIFPEVDKRKKNTHRRVALGLPRIMEEWIADRVRNQTGIYSFFFVSKNRLWMKLAESFGCLRIYKGCATYGKDL